MKFELTARTDINASSGFKTLMKRGEKFTMDNGKSDSTHPSINQVKAVITALYGAEPKFNWCAITEEYFDVKCLWK